MIPKITINLQNGQLGSVGGTTDGVAGLVIGCDPTGTAINAGDIFVLKSTDDAVTAGLNGIAYAYQQINEFFAEAGTGSKLYVLIAPNTETLTNMCDASSANRYGDKLLKYSQGEISLLGVCRKPASGYTPTVTDGIDSDSVGAITKMQVLAQSYFGSFNPFVGFVECRSYTGVPANLKNYATDSKNYVAGVMSKSSDLHAIDSGSACVGLALGRAAYVPVQRKIARVKDGSLSITGAYLGSTAIQNADFASVVLKGYICIGTYANKSGFYFVDDVLCTIPTDDYKTVSFRRTMNKMIRIVYSTFINELNDDIELTNEGKLSPATAKYYEGLIKNAVNLQMTSASELSSFSAFVDQNQNVLSTGKVAVRCAAVPKGYSQEIVVTLGFSNPALSV
jgi:hypothetical protein